MATTVEPVAGEFGTFRGVLFANVPTTSVRDRYLRRVSTISFPSVETALAAISKAIPDATVDFRSDVRVPDLFAILIGTIVELVGEKVGENGSPPRTWIYLCNHGSRRELDLIPVEVEMLETWDALRLDTGSGNVPDLECTYETYVRIAH